MGELFLKLQEECYTIKAVFDDRLSLLNEGNCKKIAVFMKESISDEALKSVNYDMCTCNEVRVIKLSDEEFKEIEGKL